MKRLITFTQISILCIFSFSIISAAEAKVVCDKFNIVWALKLKEELIEVSLDTDLPDNTVVMVDVYRSYWEKGGGEEYCVSYFEKRSTVEEWRSVNSININSENWKSLLRAKQKEMAEMGLGFDVSKISDKIEIRMVAPINQPDSRFGARNANLVGKAVRTTGLRVVEDEVQIDYPLEQAPIGRSPYINKYDFEDELKVGQTYKISKETPLMLEYDPVDPIEAMGRMKYIEKGSSFKVIRAVEKNETLWYEVVIVRPKKRKGESGWINNMALFGQYITAE